MRYNGNLDVICVGLFILFLCQLLVKISKKGGAVAASLIVSLILVFNFASGIYVQHQQYYLSVNSLYLIPEVISLLESIRPWKLVLGLLTACLLITVIVPITKRASATSTKVASIFCIFLISSSALTHTAYTKVTREDIFDSAETTPLGYLVRSTGLFPFVQQDKEWLIDQERKAIVKRLTKNPAALLPKKYSLESLKSQLGRNSSHSDAHSLRFPLFRETSENSIADPNNLNIIVMVLESVRASEMGIYGAKESATPFLDSLAAESIVASNFYATSNFTVKSEHAIHCSAYDYMIGRSTAARKNPVRSDCLPSILTRNGYQTSWFHGNDKQFYSREEYLPKIGFQSIYSSDELNPNNELTKLGWGIADPQLFSMALNELETTKKPFYSEILSVSNHLPFDFEWGIDFPANLSDTGDMYQRYRRGIYYTDQAVKSFYEQFESSPLAENTILVITGDHGIWTFSDENQNITLKNEEFFRVPLIIKHPNHNPVQITHNLSHIDLAPTIMDLLQFEAPNSFIGESIFNNNSFKKNRVLYSMTEQGLSLRTEDKLCIPTEQCQNSINCYKTTRLEPAPTQCYDTTRDRDPLHEQLRLSNKFIDLGGIRTLFDYSQIALEIGASPEHSIHKTSTATLEDI